MNAPGNAEDRAATFELVNYLDEINRLYRERRWSDGLPIVPPTRERVERMLAHTPRPPEELVARVVKRRKTSASVPAGPEVVAELSEECDVVITGSGD